MPVTPRFRITQTAQALEITINVPHIRVGDAEFHVNGLDFSFFCKPYLLRLTLPGAVEDSDVRPAKAITHFISHRRHQPLVTNILLPSYRSVAQPWHDVCLFGGARHRRLLSYVCASPMRS